MPRTRISLLVASLAFGLSLVALSGCGRYPYKIDVPQGNVITPKQLETLALGMTRNQVRFVLGTPLVADPFHPDRWDYFYSLKRDGQIVESRRLTAVFQADKLAEVRGENIPAHLAAALPLMPGAAQQEGISAK